ncbi:MAG: hypothetical protein ABSH49_23900 [Bryobacteraceae bacterium]|jgi:transposase-like protein
MNDLPLSPQMLQVIDALSSGANLTDAAARAGVHRNTIANWRRNVPPFQAALQQAESDRDLLFRERAAELADLAFASLREILADPKSSPSVRLRTALSSSKPPWAKPLPRPLSRLSSIICPLARLPQIRLCPHNRIRR